MKTLCNPLNLRYGYQHYGKYAHREGADPTLIYFKEKYYLFVSMSKGFYYSDDLIHWKFHENNVDIYKYAPDVSEVNGKLVISASTRDDKNSVLWVTDDPMSDNYERIEFPFSFWDPCIFQDDDGRVYLYWGCDCGKPIYSVELNYETLQPITEKKETAFCDSSTRGYERPVLPWEKGEKKTLSKKFFALMMRLIGRDIEKDPFFEGPFMTKIAGKYYLQYAFPATESAAYGNAVLLGDTPVGPFEAQEHNPMSIKTGGFIPAAGHGSTIFDKYGNLWHAATMRISVNASFERRVGLFPAGIDEDGNLFCNQNFADYPLDIPDGKFNPVSVRPKWMLLSYKKPVTVSSVYGNYSANNAVDENVQTSWCAEGNVDEWIMVDLCDVYKVGAIQINISDVEVQPFSSIPTNQRSPGDSNNRYIDQSDEINISYILEGSVDRENWFVIEDNSYKQTSLCNDFIELQDVPPIRYVRVTSKKLPYKKRFSICGLRVFGEGKAELPEEVTKVKAERIFDHMSCKISWSKVDGAIGYNIRYGISPDKLYLSHLQYEDTEVKLGTLVDGKDYYFAVDSFNESGITEGEVVKLI